MKKILFVCLFCVSLLSCKAQQGNNIVVAPNSFIVGYPPNPKCKIDMTHSYNNGSMRINADTLCFFTNLSTPVEGYVWTARNIKGDGYWAAAASSGITGSGTTNFLPKWNSSTTQNNSPFSVSGNNFITPSGTFFSPNTTLDKGYFAIFNNSNGSAMGYDATTVGAPEINCEATGTFITGNTEFDGTINYYAGNIGVGTATPSTGLHVNGSNSFRYVDGNQAVNKVLTSSATGVASWQTPTGGITGLTQYKMPVASNATTIINGNAKDSVGHFKYDQLYLPTNDSSKFQIGCRRILIADKLDSTAVTSYAPSYLDFRLRNIGGGLRKCNGIMGMLSSSESNIGGNLIYDKAIHVIPDSTVNTSYLTIGYGSTAATTYLEWQYINKNVPFATDKWTSYGASLLEVFPYKQISGTAAIENFSTVKHAVSSFSDVTSTSGSLISTATLRDSASVMYLQGIPTMKVYSTTSGTVIGAKSTFGNAQLILDENASTNAVGINFQTTGSNKWFVGNGITNSNNTDFDIFSFDLGKSITRFSSTGNVILNATGSAVATNATAGFTYIPSCVGTPTGVPATSITGAVPMLVDTSAGKIWFYYGGAWHFVLAT